MYEDSGRRRTSNEKWIDAENGDGFDCDFFQWKSLN